MSRNIKEEPEDQSQGDN